MLLYSLLDKKAGMYGQVMAQLNDAMMARMLREVMAPDSTPARFPEDFDLYGLGEYDELTGRIAAEAQPRFVANMSTVLQNGGR